MSAQFMNITSRPAFGKINADLKSRLLALAAIFLGFHSSFAAAPGVVIDHVPASTGSYVGSPSLAILPDGNYVASHDFFGPKTTEHERALTAVFRSSDRGATWKKISEIDGQFWSTLFTHRNALYILGTDRHHGNAIIRRSDDGPASVSLPADRH